ncbi:MAG: hypothetical protein LAO20_18885 [Acidobacteriia bacterium]|nr:hypothetical protein [Terriglobia bacterium]
MPTVNGLFWNRKQAKSPRLLVLALVLSGGCQSSFLYKCHDAEGIDRKKQLEIFGASMLFVQLAVEGYMDAAYAHFSDAAKANTSKDQFAQVLQVFKPARHFEGYRLEKIMTVTGWGDTSKTNGVAICSNDIAHPELGVTVAIQKVPEQAYTLISARSTTSHESWIISVWLVPHAGTWEVNAFHATIQTAVGKKAEDFLAMARAEKNRGHALNAGLLYSGAASLAGRGPFLHTGMEDLIHQEAQQVTPPQEFRGRAPFPFAGPSGPFSILRVNLTPLDGKIYLVIAYETDPWKDSREIEKKNHALIRAFATRFPEYSEVFGGIIAEATELGGNNGWRTVEEKTAILSHAASPGNQE